MDNRATTISDLPLDIFCQAMPNAVGILDTSHIISSLIKTSKSNTLFFQQPSADTILSRVLYQAVIDDNRQLTSHILSAKPELILMCPKKMDISSQLNWQRFCIQEDLLSVAVMRKQIKMIELLLFYYNQCDQTYDLISSKHAALSKWTPYQTHVNADGLKVIDIPEDYIQYARSLISVFNEETFPHGSSLPGIKLSDQSEAALACLRNTLSPSDSKIKLDQYIDVQLLLLAVYQAYNQNFNSFSNWRQRDHFCIQVIGIIQSMLPPEYAKLFCKGIEAAVKTINKDLDPKIDTDSASLKLNDDESFYRSSAEDISGLGYFFYIGLYGQSCSHHALPSGDDWAESLEKIMLHNDNTFIKLKADLNKAPASSPKN